MRAAQFAAFVNEGMDVTMVDRAVDRSDGGIDFLFNGFLHCSLVPEGDQFRDCQDWVEGMPTDIFSLVPSIEAAARECRRMLNGEGM